MRAALVAQLDAADLDGGGPRNAGPGKVADCVLAALGLTLVDEPDRTIAIDGAVRAAIAAADHARSSSPSSHRRRCARRSSRTPAARCDEHHRAAFEKIVAQLDERGLRMTKQPKVPLDASQAMQRLLTAAREAVLGHAVTGAVDRAKAELAAVDAAAAARDRRADLAAS